MKERLWQALRMGASWALRRYANTTLETLKLEGARLYIRGVDKLRLACAALVVGLLVLGLALAALILLPIGIVWTFDLSPHQSGLVVLGFVVVYLLIAIVTVRHLLSERVWLRFFHVDEVLAKVVEQD